MLRGCGSGGMSDAEVSRQFYLNVGGCQENLRRLGESITSDDNGAIQLGQLDQGIIDARVGEPAVGLVVTVEDEVPKSL